jgi:CRISPR-associated protein Cas8a1/Csx13
VGKKIIKPENKAGSLVMALNAPGMTPILKAGLGGLAASLRAINRKTSQNEWQCGVTVPLEDGFAKIEETKITIEWPDGGPRNTLEFLWKESFQLSNGVIYLPGAHSFAFDGRDGRPLRLQKGIKTTFLQHGKTTMRSGAEESILVDMDDGEELNFHYQPYSVYAHQNQITDIIESLCANKVVELAGWAYPGAAQRHSAYKETKVEYIPSIAIAALFGIVGCITLPNELDNGGFLIIPEPTDLVMFARELPFLLPMSYIDTAPASLGDAVLLAELYCLLNEIGNECISNIHGVLMKSMAWDKKQKYRASLVSTIAELNPSYNTDNIEIYKIMRNHLPPKFYAPKDKNKNDTWVRPSYLRAFASDNLVRGRPWYAGFSTYSKVDGKKTRYLHTYKTKDNSGLLDFRLEREGLIEMTDKLPDQERLLVQTMHEAIKNRLGKISDDQKTLGGDPNKRFDDEMLRIRLSFTNAKTQEQVRKAFADLWSKGGKLKTMQENWEQITVFITNDKTWMLARDLALIGLASYKGRNKGENEDGAN